MSLMFIFALQIHNKPSYDLPVSQLEASFVRTSFVAAFLISLSYLLGSAEVPCLAAHERVKLGQWQPVCQPQHSEVWHKYTTMFPYRKEE